ncbi:MAG: flagellar assembly protein FliW [Defluviitaleaceae bacterium]|nr:flagellar assembly protein FliW [Defluviitaleaceae bacterium]
MTIPTQNFGEITINPADIINFDEGLPGFNTNTRFIILFQESDDGDQPNPVSFLQSVDSADLCFVLVDMVSFNPEYAPMVLPFAEKENFDITGATAIYNIATVYEDMAQTTVNLKGPVLVDFDRKKGKQIICAGDEFPLRAKLFAQVEESAGDA